MVLFEAHQTLKLVAGILALVAAAAPCAGLAQSEPELRPNDQQQGQIVEKIRQIQSQDGPFSTDLIDPLTALGLSYQEHGRHDLAVAAIDRARHVVRANYGLYSLKEADLIWQEIRNEKAQGDPKAAWQLERNLLPMVRRHPNDLGVVPILRGIADERMDIFSQYRAGQLPPQIILGCYYNERPVSEILATNAASTFLGNCASGSRHIVIQSLLGEARFYYQAAIRVMDRNRRYSSDELRQLEARLIHASYLSGNYIAGKQSYRRLIRYNAANSAAWLDRVAAYVKMTDWDLLFSQHAGTRSLDRLLEAYKHAYHLLEQKHVAQASIEELFCPKIPVVLPTFFPNPLVSEETSESSGHIDVAFEVTKYGWSKHVRILGTTTHATHAAERDLVHLIKDSKFRPRVTDGGRVDTSRVVVRYYLNDKGEVTAAAGRDRS